MQLPNLDEAIRKALNELTVEEVSRAVSYAYEHEILRYGISAVAHTHLMRMARDISEGRLPQDEFLEKYGLEFSDTNYGFVVPLEKIESDGIFIPQQAYWDKEGKRRDRRVWLFNKDYSSRVNHDGWVDKEYALQLIDRKWEPSDLENLKLVERGGKFGIDMFRTCVEGFDRCKNGVPVFNYLAQPKKVTDLGGKLIAYYSALVSEPTPSK